MKTIDKIPVRLQEVEFIPDNLEPGVFYYSPTYKTATHLCGCGCGVAYPVPIKTGEWEIVKKNPLSVVPSFSHRIKCMAHYVIDGGYFRILQAGNRVYDIIGGEPKVPKF